MVRTNQGTPQKRRAFLYRDDEGRNVDVVATLEDGKVRTSGARVAELPQDMPLDVASDLRAIAAASQLYGNEPLHGIANAMYFIQEKDFRAAASVLEGGCTVEDIGSVMAGAVARMSSGEDLVAKAIERISAAAKAVVERDEKVRECRGQDPLLQARNWRFRVAVLRFDAARRMKDPDQEVDFDDRPEYLRGKELKERATKLIEGGIVADAKALATRGLSDASKERIRDRLHEDCIRAELGALVERKLRPAWEAEMAAAVKALDGLDYLAPGRPEPERDPQTYDGFAALHGLRVDIGPAESSVREPGAREGRVSHAFRVSVEGSPVFLDGRYDCSVERSPPAAADVLETTAMEASSYLCNPEADEFLNEFGFVGSLKAVRKGEAAHATCRETAEKLREMLGDEAFETFMTVTGDQPALSVGFFEASSLKP